MSICAFLRLPLLVTVFTMYKYSSILYTQTVYIYLWTLCTFSYRNQWFFGFGEPQLTEPCIYATTRTSATKSVQYFIGEATSVLLINLVKFYQPIGNIWAFHFHKLFASALQTCFRVFLWKSLFCHQRWALGETRFTQMQWDVYTYMFILYLCIFVASLQASLYLPSILSIWIITCHWPFQCQLPCGDISRVHVAGQSKKDNMSSGLLGTIRWVSSREYCDV